MVNKNPHTTAWHISISHATLASQHFISIIVDSSQYFYICVPGVFLILFLRLPIEEVMFLDLKVLQFVYFNTTSVIIRVKRIRRRLVERSHLIIKEPF